MCSSRLGSVFRASLWSDCWVLLRWSIPFFVLCKCSLAYATADDGLEGLQAQIAALQAELSSIRAEQVEQRQLLDRCGCGSSSGEERATPSLELEEAPTNVPEELDVTNGTIVSVDVKNTDWLKEVLFGGKPWLLYCDDKKSTSRMPMPSLFQESAIQLNGMATFGVLDCWERTASGKTLAHRFDFPKPPVIFAVANGDPPLVVDMGGLTKPWQLRRKMNPHLRPNVTRIDSPQTFKALCTSRRACLMVGFKAAPMLADTLAVLQPVLEDHRGVRAVAVDTSVWKVKLDDKLAATKPKKKDGQKEQSTIICVARQGGGQSRAGAFLRLTGDTALKAEHLSEFLDRCEKGKSLVPMTEAPQISFRKGEVPKYKPPPASGPSPPADKSAKKTATSSKGTADKKKDATKTRSMPSYAGGTQKKSSIRSTRSSTRSSGRKQDHVGSRDALEEEEPLFSAVDIVGNNSDEADHEEDAEDAAEEELEL